MTKALVILSGGQDSTTCLYWAIAQGYEVYTVTFDYGQRHVIELQAANKVAVMAGIPEDHRELIQIPNCLVSTSPLTSDNELEKYKDAEEMDKIIGDRVEKTFVPMRNTLFLTIAMNRAVALNCGILVTGICQADNANYPDCTERFRYLYQWMANISLGFSDSLQKFKILAPLMNMTKAQSVALAQSLPGCMEGLAYSHTSYDGKYPPTDMNHSNVLRAQGFEEAGVPDPLVVRAWREGLMELPMSHNYNVLRPDSFVKEEDI